MAKQQTPPPASPRAAVAVAVAVVFGLLLLAAAPVRAGLLLETAVLSVVHIPKTGGSSVNGFLRRFEGIRLCNRTPCCHYRQFQRELAAADFRVCNAVTYESDSNVMRYIEGVVASTAANTSSSSSQLARQRRGGDGGVRRKVVYTAVFRRPLDHVVSQGKHDVKAGRIAAVEDKWRRRRQRQQHGNGTDAAATAAATAAKGHGYNPHNLQTRKFGGLDATIRFIDSAVAVGVSEYLEQYLLVLQYKLLQNLEANDDGSGGGSRSAGRHPRRGNGQAAQQRQQLLSRPLPCFKPFIDPKNAANRIDRPFALNADDIARIRELTWEDEIAYAHALARLYADYNEVIAASGFDCKNSA